MIKSSTFVYSSAQRVAGGGIAAQRTKGMDLGGRTKAQKQAQVAIDGYRARKRAERMLVREGGLISVNLGGTAVLYIVPKSGTFRFSGFILLLGAYHEQKKRISMAYVIKSNR